MKIMPSIYKIHCLQILDIMFECTVQRRGEMVTLKGGSHLCGRRGADIGQSSGNSRTYRAALTQPNRIHLPTKSSTATISKLVRT